MLESDVYLPADGFIAHGNKKATFSQIGPPGCGVMTVKGALDEETVETLYLLMVDAIPAIGVPGQTFGGLLPDTKLTTDLDLIDAPGRPPRWVGEWSPQALREIGYDTAKLDDKIFLAVGEALEVYRAMHPVLGPINMVDTGYQFQRYKKNEGFYKEHCDSLPGHGPGRILGIVIYLNDVAEGGQTQFPTLDLYVRPEAGKILLFPGGWTHPHESRLPISDDKYIISTFIVPAPTEGEQPNDYHR